MTDVHLGRQLGIQALPDSQKSRQDVGGPKGRQNVGGPRSRQDVGGPRGRQDVGGPGPAGTAVFQTAYGPNDQLSATVRADEPKGWYSRNYLPHLDAPEIYQSVTFRLHDALPADVVRNLEEQVHSRYITDTQKRRRIETYMDAGYGACWLRQPEIAEIVQQSLWYFDGKRYRLLAWCVMPNHVHVVIETFNGYPLYKIVQSWKSYSAREANKRLGRHGAFWHRDYFDRYVRNAEHYERLIFYVEHNPVKAGLVHRAEEWLFSSVHYRTG
ncbi:REP-associated tyrosine transposase [Candidatus Thiosymbion oneisti]|uniref:REP-associated tyrosine transposase n=1 Tax=Candidatus Thiosymbion oneisti TaxID=589554 RepID=UPI00210B33EE|nr:transposase [Candidatus Thiosymbion oneisti]